MAEKTYKDRVEYYKNYYKENKLRILNRQKIKYDSCEDTRKRIRKQSSNWYVSNKEYYRSNSRRYDLKKNYGLEWEEYEIMLKDTNGKCPICQLPFDDRSKRPCVDHNHTTGQVRQILCGKCNSAFGFLNEDPGAIMRLRDYAITWETGTE